MSAYGEDDYQLQQPQDDLTTDDNVVDPIMIEENDDPTEELGIPAEPFKARLDEEIGDEDEDFDSEDVDIEDDEREAVEDQITNDDETEE